ncbi:hypothetical protein [Gordonia sp. N1V]|uniref:hypothetical protein n=1 Tax=Gordonia sp. N1V TaxID=3034163 RepID=UPI0023E2E2D9|nr:hypothetical protein [Gordonia sp. N1V]MDF3280865.1 hypothetical protein [Gordonia sp. N1V]
MTDQKVVYAYPKGDDEWIAVREDGLVLATSPSLEGLGDLGESVQILDTADDLPPAVTRAHVRRILQDRRNQ